MNWENIGGLNCLAKWSNTKAPTVVLLHGYGADARDLAGLAEVLDLPNFNWIFPNAPLEVDLGFGMTGRAWFHIDMLKLQKAADTKKMNDYFERADKDSFIVASDQVKKMALELQEKCPQLSLGGFSQGSMMAVDVVLSDPSYFKSLAILSGTYAAPIRWQEFSESNSTRIPVYQSHGELDPILPIGSAVELSKFLEKENYDTRFDRFSGGHEIPPNVIMEYRNFLSQSFEECL